MWFRIIFLISQSFLICCFLYSTSVVAYFLRFFFFFFLALIPVPSPDTHTFIWTLNFDSLPSSFSSVWGPVLEGNFGWLPPRVHVAQITPASFRTHTGLLHSLPLRVAVAIPVLPATSDWATMPSSEFLFSL